MHKNQNRPGYQESKVGWIPEGWEFSSLGKCASFLDNKRIPLKDEERQTRQGKYPYYGASGIIDYIDDYLFDDELILLGEDGANILSRSTPLSFRVKGKIWVNNHAHVIKPKENTNIGFLCEYLESISYAQYNTGTAQPKLNREICSQIPIPTPPLPEQKAIAEVLECWYKGIWNLELKIERKRNIKKGLMQRLLSGKQRLKGFSEAWETVRLGEIGHFEKGIGISKEDLSDKGIPCIRYGEIYTVHHFVLKTFHSFICSELAAQSKRIKKNDLLFAGSGETAEEIGKSVAYMNDVEAYAGGDVIILSVYPKIGRADYFSYYLNTLGREMLNRLGQGQSVVHIYPKNLSKVCIPLPPLAEQRAIADVLSAADGEIEALEKKLALWKEQKKYLLNNLVTGTIRLPEFRIVN